MKPMLVAALFLATGGWCGGTASPQGDRRGGPGPGAPSQVPTVPTPALRFRLEAPGLHIRDVTALPDGRLAIGCTFEGAAILGSSVLEAVGESDIAIGVVSPEGRVTNAFAMGSTGADELDGLQAVDGRLHAMVRLGAPLRIGEETVSPPAPRDDDFRPPEVGALVTIDPEQGARSIESVFPDLRGATRTTLAALPGGDLVLAASFAGEDLFGHAQISRRGQDGQTRWERRLDGVEIHRIVPVQLPDAEMALSLRQRNALSVLLLDGRGGDVQRVELEKAPLGVGDLGTIASVLITDGTLLAFGETGGSVVVGERTVERPSLAIQPFVLEVAPSGEPRFYDLTAGTGGVLGSGIVGADVVVLYELQHPGEAPDSQHRGVYALWHADHLERSRHLPLYQYRYERDDWRNGARITFAGSESYPYAATVLGSGELILYGWCDSKGESACLTRYSTRDAAATGGGTGPAPHPWLAITLRRAMATAAGAG